jgi:hypothetical protein
MKDIETTRIGLSVQKIAEGSDVFILGAGFSRAVSSRMPLMNDLSRMIEEDVPAAKRKRQNLGNFESYLNYLALDHPWLSEAENLRNSALFLEVSRQIGEIITKTMLPELDDADPPEWFPALLDYWARWECTIITLNYDTFVESYALKCLGWAPPPPNGLWRAATSEEGGLRVQAVPTYGHQVPAQEFRLIKLHGSVNWFYSGIRSYENEPVFYTNPFDPRDESDENKLNMFRSPGESYTDEQLSVEDKIPFIVPPLLEKTPFFRHQIVRNEWALAGKALAAASRVFCIGYSLPLSDITMHHFLGANLARRKRIRMFLVNPDPGAKEHYRTVLSSAVKLDTRLVEEKPLEALVAFLKKNPVIEPPSAYGSEERAEKALGKRKLPSEEAEDLKKFFLSWKEKNPPDGES